MLHTLRRKQKNKIPPPFTRLGKMFALHSIFLFPTLTAFITNNTTNKKGEFWFLGALD